MASAKAYGTLPKNASSSVKPFEIHIPDEDVKQMFDLLKMTPVAAPVFENSLPDGDRRFGVRRDWLVEAKRMWETDFDWRKCEAHINSFPNYKASVQDSTGDFEIHFAALFSTREDAVPLILLHGWPGSFLEFLPLLGLLQKKYTPESLPYHVIVPSLPGYAFSSAQRVSEDLARDDVARVMDKVMREIGFMGYVAQGGDVGSGVARSLGVQHEACKAVHVNFVMVLDQSKMDHSQLTATEKAGLERFHKWRETGMAYALEQGTKPATLGFVLTSSPLATLAWIGEKFLDWSDADPSIPTILEAASLYYLTKCVHSNIWSYRHNFRPGAKGQDHPDYHLKKPLGYSLFPREIMPCPVSWVATTGDLVWHTTHDRGGHFAALEEPAYLLEDLEAFVAQVWK